MPEEKKKTQINDRRGNLKFILEKLERTTKMLAQRDLELAQVQKKREIEIKEFRSKAKDLEETREVLLNILEDAEEARRIAIAEKNRTLSIINSLTDGLMFFDENNNLSFMNPACEEMFRVRREEIEGKNAEKIKENSLLSPIINLIFWGGKVKKIEKAEFSPEQHITIEVTTVLLRGPGETGCIVIFHDISREKVVEALKSEFVSIAAHQLRTPLSAIKWSLSLLAEGQAKKEEREDLIDKVSKSNDRMIRLINDLLDITRIEEGRYVYKLTREDIKSIVRESIKPLREEARRKDVQLKLSAPKKNIPQVRIDKEKMNVAIQNLTENAVHYTKPNGRITITLTHDKRKKEVLLTFEDTGVGISKKQQHRVFSRFFRGENVVQLETEGSGLGLFIAKNIIEAHRGKIWFKSKIGVGSTFYFTLPVV